MITREQQQKMRDGRERSRKQRAREARARVRQYTRWLNAGCPKGRIPDIPSDSDYRLARGGSR
jgi:hypothetical protein